MGVEYLFIMPGNWEREKNVATEQEELVYKVPVSCILSGVGVPATIYSYINFGTDSILANQRSYPRVARKLKSLFQGEDIPDPEYYMRQLSFGRYGTITGFSEVLYTYPVPLSDTSLNHIENIFAEPRILIKKYGRLPYFLDVFQGRRPKSPLSPIRLECVMDENEEYSSMVGWATGSGSTPNVWEIRLGYYHKEFSVGHDYLTGTMSQHEATKFIIEREQMEADERVAEFVKELKTISKGFINCASPDSRLLGS